MLPLLLPCTPCHHLLPHPPLHPPRHPMLQLLDSGRWDVTVFDIRAVEGESRAECIVGDLRDAAQVAAACKGATRGWLLLAQSWLLLAQGWLLPVRVCQVPSCRAAECSPGCGGLQGCLGAAMLAGGPCLLQNGVARCDWV